MTRLSGWYVPGQRLGDDPVQPGAFEELEPLLGQLTIGRRRGDVDRRPGVGERVDQQLPALGERPARQVVVAEGQQVEGDERRRGLLGEQLHPRGGRVDALLQRLEIQPPLPRDDDLAVDDAALRQVAPCAAATTSGK